MKRKILSSLLAATIACSIVACGGKKNEVTPSIEAEPVVTQAPEVTEEPTATEEATGNDTVQGETVGSVLLDVFHETVAANDSLDAAGIAETIISHESIAFGGATMPIEPGLLSGFDNAEITGFEEGVQFGPMIGSIPFIGYVFTLPEDADQTAFMDTLKDNANLRWNICVEADELIVEANGNKVFFLMCPNSFEQE